MPNNTHAKRLELQHQKKPAPPAQAAPTEPAPAPEPPPNLAAITALALKEGLSTPEQPDQAVHSALTQGALSIATALYKTGHTDRDLQPVADLWKQDVQGLDVVRASEKLFGPRGERLPYRLGTPLGDFLATLVGKVRDAPELAACLQIIRSVQAKLALMEINARPKQGTA